MPRLKHLQKVALVLEYIAKQAVKWVVITKFVGEDVQK